ncbi:hypothetical protein ACFVH4_08695 [Nocardia ignorata]|uniref:hypothetical protein n=1 Tax=Nocardia ignorata TaxID=145285 RepID=UPI0036403AC9
MPTLVLAETVCDQCRAPTLAADRINSAECDRLCSSCGTELSVCDECGSPSSDLIGTEDGDQLCADCRAGWSRCPDCHGLVRDLDQIAGGHDVCSSCAQDYLRCGDCLARTAHSYTVDGGAEVCERCENDYRECDDCVTLVPIGTDRCSECRTEHPAIHDYFYKPSPVFHGDGPLYLGLELEIRATPDGFTDSVDTTVTAIGDLAYLKQDGSISCGFELVTHPMTYHYAITEFPWSLLPRLRLLGCHTDDGVGIHIHLSRDGFDSPAHIYRWMKFIHRNQSEVIALARRNSTWAQFSPAARRRCREFAHGSHHGFGRQQAINVFPEDTFELRVFASSLKLQQVQAALGFAHASVEYTRALRSRDIARDRGWEWSTFATWLVARPDYAPLVAELARLGIDGHLACAS